MKNLKLKDIAGATIILLFFLTFISAFFFQKIEIYGHIFLLPAIFLAIIFTIFWLYYTLPAIKAKMYHLPHILVSLLILAAFVIPSHYLGWYEPLQWRHIITFDPSITHNTPHEIEGEVNKKYNIVFNLKFRARDADKIPLTISLSNEEWSTSTNHHIGFSGSRNDGYVAGDITVKLPYNLPKKDTYQIKIESEEIAEVEEISVFESR